MNEENKETTWYDKGIRFECQGSGKCCTSHGEYGFVYMTDNDRLRMAEHLNMELKPFTKEYCHKTDGYYHLIQPKKTDDCQFLKNKKCTIYPGRPSQCRSWPFWPEVMDAKVWAIEVQAFCPGINKGRLYTKSEIEASLQKQLEEE